MVRPRLLSPCGQCLIAGLLVLLNAPQSSQAQQVPTAVPQGAKATRIPMRDPINEQEVRKIVSATATMDAQMAAKVKPMPEARPNVQNSLLTNSVILSDGKAFTLVPVGSVLHLPPSHRNRILEKPEGEFVFWPAFLEQNSSWLTAREVPLKMAKGNAKAGEAIMRAVAMETKTVISTYKGGPISILEPVPGTEGTKETTSNSADADATAAQAQPNNRSKR